jgi:hypothetical protein
MSTFDSEEKRLEARKRALQPVAAADPDPAPAPAAVPPEAKKGGRGKKK